MKNFKTLFRHERPFVFNLYVKPAQLPTSPVSYNTDCVVSGWGKLSFGGSTPHTPYIVTVPTMTWQQCTETYDSSLVNEKTMFCMGLESGGKVLVVFCLSFGRVKTKPILCLAKI